MIRIVFISFLLFLFTYVNGQNRYELYPKTDYNYSATDWKFNTKSEIEDKFNEARIHEEIELGVNLPSFKLPATWSQFDNGQKLLWIINKERKDRGLSEVEKLDENLNNISERSLLKFEEQNRNDLQFLKTNRSFLLKGDEFLMDEFNGIDNSYNYEVDKIEQNYLISVISHDDNSPLVEMILYNFIYSDSENNWKNRDFILNTKFKENGGDPYKEGFVAYSLINLDGRKSASKKSILSILFLDPGENWSYKPFESSNEKLDFEISTSTSEITINVLEDSESTNVEVYNLIGQLILNKEVHYGIDNTFRIDGNRGYYLVRLKSGAKQKAVKVYIP